MQLCLLAVELFNMNKYLLIYLCQLYLVMNIC